MQKPQVYFFKPVEAGGYFHTEANVHTMHFGTRGELTELHFITNDGAVGTIERDKESGLLPKLVITFD